MSHESLSRGRVRHPRAGARVVAAAVAVVAIFAAQWASASADDSHSQASASSSHQGRGRAPHQGWVKYYIVQPPRDGRKEFLYEIAAKTLGNGKLAMKIFQLNKGRPQPGHGRLETPAVIQPGWILVLPASASGPGVHYGPLPARGPRHQRAGTYTAILGGAILIAFLLLAAAVVVVLRRRRAATATPKSRAKLTVPSVPGPQAGDAAPPDDAQSQVARSQDALAGSAHGRGSLRRRQWSAPPVGPSAGDSGAQDLDAPGRGVRRQ